MRFFLRDFWYMSISAKVVEWLHQVRCLVPTYVPSQELPLLRIGYSSSSSPLFGFTFPWSIIRRQIQDNEEKRTLGGIIPLVWPAVPALSVSSPTSDQICNSQEETQVSNLGLSLTHTTRLSNPLVLLAKSILPVTKKLKIVMKKKKTFRIRNHGSC